jgi:twitching motility two-component system response regulator PilH
MKIAVACQEKTKPCTNKFPSHIMDGSKLTFQGGRIMSKKVLVVDDDPDVRLFSVTVLEENGYSPIEAANGEEGLKMIKAEKPDLIILDVLMPRQSGIRLYREMKTDKALKDIPIIILSGIAKKTFLRSQKAMTEFGGKPVPEPEIYLEKPVEPEELAATIKKVMGG